MIFEIIGGAILFGFCSVFGWNTGSIVWDRYVDTDKRIEKSVGLVKEETVKPPSEDTK